MTIHSQREKCTRCNDFLFNKRENSRLCRKCTYILSYDRSYLAGRLDAYYIKLSNKLKKGCFKKKQKVTSSPR